MGDLFTLLRENGDLIVQAPLPALLWAIAIGGIMFAAIRAAKTNQIENLESRLRLRDDEIADYKRKLEGASPDEAKAKIEALEAKLARLAPRRLSQTQRTAIISGLACCRGSAQVAHLVSSADAGRFAADIASTIGSSGWQVSTVTMMGGEMVSGLEVHLHREGEETAALLHSLKIAELSFSIVRDGLPLSEDRLATIIVGQPPD